MNIYGYTKQSDELLKLSEISLKCSVNELDDIIDFLKYVKEEKIKYKDEFGHEHFKDWIKKSDIVDIVVV